MADPDPCDCLGCSIIELIDDEYPHGLGAEEMSEAATALAAVAGRILARATDESLDNFILGARIARDKNREINDRDHGGKLQ